MTTPSSENQPYSSSQESIDEKTVDVRDLVSKGGYQKDPREIIQNPAVAPQMLDDSQDSDRGFDYGDPEEKS